MERFGYVDTFEPSASRPGRRGLMGPLVSDGFEQANSMQWQDTLLAGNRYRRGDQSHPQLLVPGVYDSLALSMSFVYTIRSIRGTFCTMGNAGLHAAAEPHSARYPLAFPVDGQSDQACSGPCRNRSARQGDAPYHGGGTCAGFCRKPRAKSPRSFLTGTAAIPKVLPIYHEMKKCWNQA